MVEEDRATYKITIETRTKPARITTDSIVPLLNL